ncbi:hypothetical protein [Thiolapillus brandeum]|uniref:hypothetical protein n=1 Tax=Thiolapillus brandeum TaxID=1076588 RepID=UPI001185430A|nr:hypothetical protein [Thiolapillus brandeum]
MYERWCPGAFTVIEACGNLLIEMVDMTSQQSQLEHQGHHHQLIGFDDFPPGRRDYVDAAGQEGRTDQG